MNVQPWRDRGLYFAVIGLALVVVIQATLLTRVRFIGAQPDLLLVLVVCWSLLFGVSEGLLFAFFGGLGVDVIAGMPLGSTSLALMPVCFLGVVGRTSVYVNNIWLPVLLVTLATPLAGWLMLLIRQLLGTPVDWGAATMQVVFPAIGLNVLLTIFVARLMRRLGGRVRPEAAV